MLDAEFRKLVPYKPLTAPEIVAIKNALVAWLAQFQAEIDQLSTVDECSIDYRDAQQDLMNKLVTVKVEKIEGDPVSYLLKWAGIENASKETQEDNQ